MNPIYIGENYWCELDLTAKPAIMAVKHFNDTIGQKLQNWNPKTAFLKSRTFNKSNALFGLLPRYNLALNQSVYIYFDIIQASLYRYTDYWDIEGNFDKDRFLNWGHS